MDSVKTRWRIGAYKIPTKYLQNNLGEGWPREGEVVKLDKSKVAFIIRQSRMKVAWWWVRIQARTPCTITKHLTSKASKLLIVK